MTDILIKSFNRPYYLDRCLNSIEKFVSGDYSVIILDDGTPQKYLDKIKEKHPNISIKKSKNYQNKEKAIAKNITNGTEINGFQIPTDLWIDAVKNASEYFIMTEDDAWFTEPIDVDNLYNIMKTKQMTLIKIGWISNRKLKSQFFTVPNTDIIFIKPNIFTAPSFIMDCFFENRFKLFSILRRLKIVDANSKNEYWVMNSMLMGFFNKNYWLDMWKNINGKVNEQLLLKNAIQWYRNNKDNTFNFGKLDSLKMNTTFQSSATNSYHKYGIECDINMFNYIINEKWLKGEFDSMQNFPKDISKNYYAHFLLDANSDRCSLESWKQWAEKFKEQYRKQGVVVD